MYWLLGILLKLLKGFEDDDEDKCSWDDDKADESEEEDEEFDREVREDECKDELPCIEGIEAGDLSKGDIRIDGLDATAAARC